MKRNNLPDIERERARQANAKKSVSPAAKKRAIFISLLSFINLIIYFGVVPTLPPMAQFGVHIAYMAIFGASLVVYIVYNRAFSRKNITIEMLPDVWTAEQKAAYILDGEERLRKSKWLMYIIIPFLGPIGVDAMILFVWDAYLKDVFAQIVGGIG